MLAHLLLKKAFFTHFRRSEREQNLSSCFRERKISRCGIFPLMDKPQERKRTLKPNATRSLAQSGQDPDEVRAVARALLDEAGYASTLMDSSTAIVLSRVASDRDLWLEDNKAMESMCRYAVIDRTSVKDHPLAPIARWLARVKLRESLAGIKPETRRATQARHDMKSRISASDRVWLDSDTPVSKWPKTASGQAVTPLQIAVDSETEYAVSFNPYQFQAAGIIELVRASGKALGSCDGDALAERFQLMILAFGGIKASISDNEKIDLTPLVASDELLTGGFLRAAVSGNFSTSEPYRSISTGYLKRASGGEWWPLSGPDQLLAINILAAWLRMSTLGVRLSSWETLAAWREFFDGTSYGVNDDLVGVSFILDDVDAQESMSRYQLHGEWASGQRVPWFEREGGSPVVFMGIAAELLYLATKACGILDFVSEDFIIPTSEEEFVALTASKSAVKNRLGQHHFGNYKLIQLRRIHRLIVDNPQGCAKGVSLVSEYNYRGRRKPEVL